MPLIRTYKEHVNLFGSEDEEKSAEADNLREEHLAAYNSMG